MPRQEQKGYALYGLGSKRRDTLLLPRESRESVRTGALKGKKRVGAGGSVQEIRSDGTVLHLLRRLPLPRHPQAAGLALDSELPSQRAGNLESAGAFTLPPKPKKKKKKKKKSG